MTKPDKEPRSERVQVSLKPSTLALLQRYADVTQKPVATLISELVEESEGAFRLMIGALEKVKAAKDSAARKREAELVRRASKG